MKILLCKIKKCDDCPYCSDTIYESDNIVKYRCNKLHNEFFYSYYDGQLQFPKECPLRDAKKTIMSSLRVKK